MDAPALVAALLEATPEPPHVTTDASEVLALGEAMTAARAAILPALAEVGDFDRSSVASELAVLRDRDARWSASLTRARHQLGERLASAARGRGAYASVR